MKNAGTAQRRVVGVAQDVDFLRSLEREIHRLYPDCRIDKVTTAADECKLKALAPNDLVVWDITRCSFADLVSADVNENQPILILQNDTGPAENLERVEGSKMLRHIEKGDIKRLIHAVQDFFTSPRRSAFRRLADGAFRALTPEEAYQMPTGDDKLFFY